MEKLDKVFVGSDPNCYTTHPSLLYTSKTYNKVPKGDCEGVIVGEVTDKVSSREKVYAVDIKGNIYYITESHLESIMTPEQMMEGVCNIMDLSTLKTVLRLLTTGWLKEGFDKDDVKEYLNKFIDEI